MGGYGSGRWYRGLTRTTCEEAKRIDIRYLRQQGLLGHNHAGTLSWNIGGEPSGNINYTMFSDQMWLRFRCRWHDEEWEDVKQIIPLVETPCNYGGTRKWFLCPHCNKRIAVLYLVDTYFMCRHCYQLPYASQGEDYLDRLTRKSDKISARLEADEYIEYDGYYKPKGMHWRTFYHLKMTENDLEDRTQNALFARFGCYL